MALVKCPDCGKQWALLPGQTYRAEDWLGEHDTLSPWCGEEEEYQPEANDAGRARCPRCYFKGEYQESKTTTDNSLVYRQRIKKRY